MTRARPPVPSAAQLDAEQAIAALPALATPEQVADLLRVHPKTARRFVHEGLLEAVRAPVKRSRMRITRTSVARYIARRLADRGAWR